MFLIKFIEYLKKQVKGLNLQSDTDFFDILYNDQSR